MPDSVAAIAKNRDDHPLVPLWVESLLVTRGRLSPQSMKAQLGHEQLIILSHKSRLAYLILVECHEIDHRRSPGDAMWRSRLKGYWIIQGMKLAKQVVKRCYWCKKQSKATITQQMGDLPSVKFSVP